MEGESSLMKCENAGASSEPKDIVRPGIKRKNEDSNMEVEVNDPKSKKNEDSKMEVEVKGPKSKKKKKNTKYRETRTIYVPKNRKNPLYENWEKIVEPITTFLHLNIRRQFKDGVETVQLATSELTEDISNIQKAQEFIKAFMYGFDIEDALALIRLESLYMESFDIKDVKTLKGDHLDRAIGRISGKGGRTKYTIENSTKTRIVIANTRVHILGSFLNIQVAMKAICNLILGSPPTKVYGNLKNVAGRLGNRL